MSNLFDLLRADWATTGAVTVVGNTWVVPIEGSFSADTNGRLTYHYADVSPAGDRLTGTISYTITATDAPIWFVVMPDGAGGQYSKQLAASGDPTPITGSFGIDVAIPAGSPSVEFGTYNQQYAAAGGPAPGGYGSMGNFVTPLPPLTPPPPPPCEELGRVTKCYVSGYQRNRVHQCNVMPRERRCLTADFTGALPKGRTIVSAAWSTLNPVVVNMQQGECFPTQTSVVCLFQYAGVSIVRCVATLDNGDQYVQQFRCIVQPYVWFQGDTNYSTGPYTINLTVTT